MTQDYIYSLYKYSESGKDNKNKNNHVWGVGLVYFVSKFTGTFL